MQALAIITLPSYLVSVSLPQKTDPNCFLWLDYHSVHQHNRTLQALAIIKLQFYCWVCLMLGMRWLDFSHLSLSCFRNLPTCAFLLSAVNLVIAVGLYMLWLEV